MSFGTVANAIKFALGVVILVLAMLGDPDPLALIIVALVLMGVITVDQLAPWPQSRRRRTSDRRLSDNGAGDESGR